jgi:hypothetical protein
MNFCYPCCIQTNLRPKQNQKKFLFSTDKKRKKIHMSANSSKNLGKNVDDLRDEQSVIKIQSIGRRKLAQRRVALQRELHAERTAERDTFRQQPIAMPADDLEEANAAAAQQQSSGADGLRHPVHPFNKADPSKFVVKDKDQVAGGMQRVYRRMLQSKTWW